MNRQQELNIEEQKIKLLRYFIQRVNYAMMICGDYTNCYSYPIFKIYLHL